MLPPATPTALLFAYAFLSNIALAVVPHEPAIIWYAPRLGLWTTTLVATAGTMLAAVVDHRMFVPLIRRMAQRRSGGQGGRSDAWPERLFRRFPFGTIALSGLTPLPFFPFKALAFATGCPAGKYCAAVAARCLPRYALLAWLGAAVQVPVWVMVVLFALLMVPSLRMVWWPRAAN